MQLITFASIARRIAVVHMIQSNINWLNCKKFVRWISNRYMQMQNEIYYLEKCGHVSLPVPAAAIPSQQNLTDNSICADCRSRSSNAVSHTFDSSKFLVSERRSENDDAHRTSHIALYSQPQHMNDKCRNGFVLLFVSLSVWTNLFSRLKAN